VYARGLGRETLSNTQPGVRLGGRASEVGQRNMQQTWLRYMTAGQA
jgi:hypothetical protein